MFIAINTKVDGERGAQNPANSLVRYQLMELLIRVAMDKYALLPNEAQAFEKVCEEHLMNKIDNYPD